MGAGKGERAAAFVTGSDRDAIARVLGRASATIEILDVWRVPEERFPRQWEERFIADTMAPAIADTARRALEAAGVEPSTIATVILDGTNPRSMAGLPKALGLRPEQVADPLAASVGRAGVAHAGLLLARALDQAKRGDRILVVCEADGADALVLEVTEAITDARPVRKVDRWIASKRNDLPYNTYLKWRGILPFEPPRRPDPERPAAPPMRRHERWKLAFVGARRTKCQTGHLPPQRVCVKCGAVDQMRDERFADTSCRVATYTLDHLAYSLQPPVVAAFVDYEGGGRFSSELTDVDPKDVAIGNHLEMAIGVEKLKDSGYSGLVGANPPNDGTLSSMTAPATFSLLAPAYARKYGVEEGTLKQVLARIAWKNHKNGAKNPKAQFRKEVPIETICKSPPVAGMLGIFDCSGVSDGSAAAILCRAEDAHRYSKDPIFIKALSFAAGPAEGYYSQDYDFTTFP